MHATWMHARTHACAHTHTHTPVACQGYQGNETEEKVFKIKVFKEDLKELTRMVDRNRVLVPDNWSLLRERVLTTGLCSEGWYSKHLGVCRRLELPGGSVKVKKFWKVDGSLRRNDLEQLKQSKDNLYLILCSIGSQWREWSIGVTWADLVVLKMSLAALFCTFWSLERRYLGQPAKSKLQ